MNFNSRFVQWLLKFGLSKMGAAITTIAAQLAAHAVIWLGLNNFMSAAAVAQIQGGFETAALALGASLQAIIYGYIVHKQTAGVMVLKQQLNLSAPATPLLDDSGSVGNKTLQAAAIVTGVPIEKAMANVAAAA